MGNKLFPGLALVAAMTNPCAAGVLTVGAQNPVEYVRPGESYLASCYLVDPAAGDCRALLHKELAVQPERARQQVALVASSGRLLNGKKDLEKGAVWCKFEVPAGCTYEERRGNLVVVLARAASLNPADAQPIADGCREDVSFGTGKEVAAQVRLGRRADAPDDIGVPNPLP